MDEADITKVLRKILAPLPQNKALLQDDIQIGFQTLTGESINDHLDLVNKVLNNLHDKKIIRFEMFENRTPRVWKGLNFDNLESTMSSRPSNSHISIGSLNAQNIQVGNENNMSINITAEQFANALSSLANKQPEEAKSIVEKISSFVATGTTVVEAVSKFIGLAGG